MSHAQGKASLFVCERLIKSLLEIFKPHHPILCEDHDAIEETMISIPKFIESKTNTTKFSAVALWTMVDLAWYPASKVKCNLCRQLFKAHKALIKAVYTAKYGWEEK